MLYKNRKFSWLPLVIFNLCPYNGPRSPGILKVAKAWIYVCTNMKVIMTLILGHRWHQTFPPSLKSLPVNVQQKALAFYMFSASKDCACLLYFQKCLVFNKNCVCLCIVYLTELSTGEQNCDISFTFVENF